MWVNGGRKGKWLLKFTQQISNQIYTKIPYLSSLILGFFPLYTSKSSKSVSLRDFPEASHDNFLQIIVPPHLQGRLKIVASVSKEPRKNGLWGGNL